MSRSPLISPEQLHADVLAGRGPLLLDARPSRAGFDAGHLRGAIHARLDRDLSTACEPDFDPARGGRHPLPSIARWAGTLGSWGIAPGIPVVVYDQSDGSNAAARAWWMLRAAGHGEVQVLDGGFVAALAAGLPVGADRAAPAPRPPYPATRWILPLAGMAEVDEARRDPARRVLDVRSAPRYRGETEPIDPVAGRIPGAINLFFGENMEGGRFKSPHALRTRYEELFDGLPPARVIVHCGSGVTACHTLLALETAGLPGAALYAGSWSEWCRSDRPRDRDSGPRN